MRGWASVAVIETERDSRMDRKQEDLGAGGQSARGGRGADNGRWDDDPGERFESWILWEVGGRLRREREQGDRTGGGISLQ
jgi:hypothetical protein